MRSRKTLVPRPDSLRFLLSAGVSFLLALKVLSTTDPLGSRPVPAGPGVSVSETLLPSAGAPPIAHEPVPVRRSISDGIRWLLRHQFSDGSWSAYFYPQMCDAEFCDGAGEERHDLGVTALSALALLSDAGIAKAPEIHDGARRALGWLENRQETDGGFGSDRRRYLYGHALATMAFARGYRALGDPRFPGIVRAGIRFLERSRNPDGGWRFADRAGGSDTSVTGWVAAAIQEARSAGIEVPSSALEGIRVWLDRATDPRYYHVLYTHRAGKPLWSGDGDPAFGHAETLTAVGLWLRSELREPASSPAVVEGRGRLRRDLPAWTDGRDRCADFCYWYFGLRALSSDTDAGPTRKWWSSRLRSLLAERQRKYAAGENPCLWGSWDPADRWGREGGRVYATAINVLTLSLLLEDRAGGRRD